ncbi:hypothetical protein RA27_10450 [Ruegeria sp. ANG-R]|nr:hypothetical protein RA27_10450 [Ruegeria sp. ANG-R]
MELLVLGENEQPVYAVRARLLPSLSDAILIAVIAPTLMMFPWVMIHFIFRRTIYVITTQRVVVLDAGGVVSEMCLSDIKNFRGSRTALLLRGARIKLWLPRLPDAWHFEDIIRRTIKKTTA